MNFDLTSLFTNREQVFFGSEGYTTNEKYPSAPKYTGDERVGSFAPKTSNALFAISAFKDDRLFCLANADKTEIYCKYTDKDLTRQMLASEEAGKWTVAFCGTPNLSRRSMGVLGSILAASLKNFFQPDIHPVQFCDAVYYGFLKEHATDIEFQDVPSDGLEVIAQMGYSRGQLTSLVGTCPWEGPTIKETPKPVSIVTADWDTIKTGSHILPYKWTDEQKEKIVDLGFLDDFVPTKNFFSLLNKIEKRFSATDQMIDDGASAAKALSKNMVNIRLMGDPGTGKTTMAYALGAALGLPVYQVPIQKGMEVDEFEGKNVLVDGKPQFVETDFLKGFVGGGIVVLEEIDIASPDLLKSLNNTLVFPFCLHRNGFEPVFRNPHTILIATHNLDTAASRPIDESVKRRFSKALVIEDPSAEECIHILEQISSCDKETCSWVYNAYVQVKNFLKQPKYAADEIALSITLTACQGILQDIEDGEDPSDALLTFYSLVYGEDRQLADDLLTSLRSIPPLRKGGSIGGKK